MLLFPLNQLKPGLDLAFKGGPGGGGGEMGCKDYVRACTHHERESRSPLQGGIRCSLVHLLSLILKHSDTKRDTRKLLFFGGGGGGGEGCCAPPRS